MAVMTSVFGRHSTGSVASVSLPHDEVTFDPRLTVSIRITPQRTPVIFLSPPGPPFRSVVGPDWVRENYAGMGSVVRHTPVHPAYALFGLPSIVTVPLASP